MEDNNGLPGEVSAENDISAAMAIDVSLPDSSDMDSNAAHNVMRTVPTRIILCAGPADSGKTTLLSRIYESFQHGPFAGLNFAGSATLHGFERRCHLARAVSGRSMPDMEHTPTSLGLRFLHLRVRVVGGGSRPEDILLADLGGEIFEAVKNSEEACKGLGVIARSDVFALLLDGGRLANAEKRADTVASGMSLVRRCVESQMLGIHSTVDVVISKYDLFKAGNAGGNQYADHIQKEFKRRFDGEIGALRFHRIAAIADRGSGVKAGFGLEEAFRAWARGPTMAERKLFEESRKLERGGRMFFRFPDWGQS